jgi:hypothetical protein
VGDVPPIVQEVLRSPGQPLDAATRAVMEPRFGHDFSRVPSHIAAQSKLTISQPGDRFEQEAERTAARVTSTVPQPGRGHDFSEVRVHTDARAAESARAVGARAYAVGRDVVFGAGQYAPGGREGRRLMAHELAHVVQQHGTPGWLAAQPANAATDDFRLGHLFPWLPQSARHWLPTIKYETGDLHSVPNWTYIAYFDQGLVQLRYFNSKAKLEIGTIGWITNNPGNIDYGFPGDKNAGPAAFEAAKQGAYTKKSTDTRYRRFAIFPSRQEGIDAILPVLGKYLTASPNGTVEEALKRYKGAEPDLSDFKILFPGEPLPKTPAEKKAAAARVKDAYVRSIRESMATSLREQHSNLSQADIQTRVDKILTTKFSSLDQSSEDAQLLRHELLRKEGGLNAPGVTFSCYDGFTSASPSEYTKPQREEIEKLTSSAAARKELATILGCAEKG